MNKTMKSMLAIATVGAMLTTGAVRAQDDSDTRELAKVSKHWRMHLLQDMREGLFVQVQEILEAASSGDMQAVDTLATERGKAHFKKMDPAMMQELPMGMKGMGKNMHLAFDDVATAARSGDNLAVMGAVSDLMLACTACHMTYKLNP